MQSVQMTDEEAKAFLLFREHQKFFTAILLSRIYEIRRGNAVLHFSPDGQLMKIETQLIAFENKNNLTKE